MSTVLSFNEKLHISCRKNRSLLCVGLDPEPGLVPDEEVVDFNRVLVTATLDLVCAYKPNTALYEAMGTQGVDALKKTIDIIRENDPDIPIIGDAKGTDIGNCGDAHVTKAFKNYDFDAVTVSPYMGFDSIEPFLDWKGKSIFVLCRTSNPHSGDLQDLMVVGAEDSAPRPLYEKVALLAQSWNKIGNVGLVVGATFPEEIGRVRQACPDMWFLVPGIGAQGGDLRATVSSAMDANGSGFIINVSRQVMYAARNSEGDLFNMEAFNGVRNVARGLRDRINDYRALHPLGEEQPQEIDADKVENFSI